MKNVRRFALTLPPALTVLALAPASLAQDIVVPAGVEQGNTDYGKQPDEDDYDPQLDEGETALVIQVPNC